MPRMGEGEPFAGRGQGGPQAAARSAAAVRGVIRLSASKSVPSRSDTMAL